MLNRGRLLTVVAGMLLVFVLSLVVSTQVYAGNDQCKYFTLGCLTCNSGVKCSASANFARCKTSNDDDDNCVYDGGNVNCGTKYKYQKSDCSDESTTDGTCTRSAATGTSCS
jgi:hypothetical protein